MSAEKLLEITRQHLLTGWCRNALARDDYGDPCFVNATDCYQWSLVGAMQAAELVLAEANPGAASEAYSQAYQRLVRIVGEKNLHRWNDSPRRVYRDVLGAVEKAMG